jgi:T-complex protein 1 subunit beta
LDLLPFFSVLNLTWSLRADMTNGTVGDVAKLGITESFKVKSQVLLSAAEAAEMVLRVDEIVKVPPRARRNDPRYG